MTSPAPTLKITDEAGDGTVQTLDGQAADVVRLLLGNSHISNRVLAMIRWQIKHDALLNASEQLSLELHCSRDRVRAKPTFWMDAA